MLEIKWVIVAKKLHPHPPPLSQNLKTKVDGPSRRKWKQEIYLLMCVEDERIKGCLCMFRRKNGEKTALENCSNYPFFLEFGRSTVSIFFVTSQLLALSRFSVLTFIVQLDAFPKND